jgi:hypothetical protein
MAVSFGKALQKWAGTVIFIDVLIEYLLICRVLEKIHPTPRVGLREPP